MQWFSNMYYITFFTLAPLCVKPVEWRFDYSMFACAAVSTLGTWIVWIAGQSFLLAMIGFFIIGVADAMILIVPVCNKFM